jgi:hypothetical protein
MTTIFKTERDELAERYLTDLDSAILAETLAAGSSLPIERQKALRRLWAIGKFNAAAFGLDGAGASGELEWMTHGEQLRLLYRNPLGPSCFLAQCYRQPNGTWAALVVAGVGEDRYEAMARAEWAVSRLTA